MKRIFPHNRLDLRQGVAAGDDHAAGAGLLAAGHQEPASGKMSLEKLPVLRDKAVHL